MLVWGKLIVGNTHSLSYTCRRHGVNRNQGRYMFVIVQLVVINLSKESSQIDIKAGFRQTATDVKI